MRIRDLFEGEMILLESYKDYRQVFINTYQNLDDMEVRRVNARLSSLDNTMGLRKVEDFPAVLESFLRNQRYVALLKSAPPYSVLEETISRVKTSTKIRNITDISSWISNLSSIPDNAKAHVMSNHITAVSILMYQLDEEIKKRIPDYTTVAKTSSYIIFDVKNFAAAKKLRDQVGSTWCIGANEGHFESYGEDQRRKTYIVFLLKTRKGMVIHVNPSNPSDNLVTSHSNETEAVVRGGEMVYTRMHTSVDYEIERDLADAVPSHDIVELFRQVGIRLKNTPITTTTTSSLPMHILVDFTNRLNGRDIMFSKTIKNIVVRSEARYEGMYKSGDVRAMSRHLASIIDMTMLSISVELDFVSDVKEVIAMFSLVSAIASHVHELQLEGFLPKNLPSDDLDSIVNMSIIDMKRYGTVTKTASIAIDNMRKYQKQLENVRI